MARDKTFSGRDVIRIWSNHLTRLEQVEVACFFDLYVRGITQVSKKDRLSSQLTRKLVGILLAFFPQTAVVDKLLELFSNSLEVRELKACEKVATVLPRPLVDGLPDFNELLVDLLTAPPLPMIGGAGEEGPPPVFIG